MKNYIDLGSCDFGRRRLMMFLDTDAYHSVASLKSRNVRMKFKIELSRDGDQYHLIFIRVLKKDILKFYEAMEDLKRKMLICGHTDYETRGAEVIGKMEERIRKKAG